MIKLQWQLLIDPLRVIKVVVEKTSPATFRIRCLASVDFRVEFYFQYSRVNRQLNLHPKYIEFGLYGNEEISFYESYGLPLMFMWTHYPQNVLYRLPLDLMHMIVDFI